ncbi:hypothetical protein AB0I13_06415 [Streptomyces prasinus]
MPRLAFTNGFRESCGILERPVKAGVRKAMRKLRHLAVPEARTAEGLRPESIEKARAVRMRILRTDAFRRGVVLAPDDGSDVFPLVNVVRHDDACAWAAERRYTANSANSANSATRVPDKAYDRFCVAGVPVVRVRDSPGCDVDGV